MYNQVQTINKQFWWNGHSERERERERERETMHSYDTQKCKALNQYIVRVAPKL